MSIWESCIQSRKKRLHKTVYARSNHQLNRRRKTDRRNGGVTRRTALLYECTCFALDFFSFDRSVPYHPFFLDSLWPCRDAPLFLLCLSINIHKVSRILKIRPFEWIPVVSFYCALSVLFTDRDNLPHLNAIEEHVTCGTFCCEVKFSPSLIYP